MAQEQQVVTLEQLKEMLLDSIPEDQREAIEADIDGGLKDAEEVLAQLQEEGLICYKPAVDVPEIKSAGFEIDDFEKLAEGKVGHFNEEKAHEVDRGDHRIETFEVDDDLLFLACDGCGMRPLPRQAFVLHVNEKTVEDSVKAKSYFACARACAEGIAVTAMVEKELLSEDDDGVETES